ncbi:MAG: hypothetical protein GVY04_23060 [Cyanobacteria bacterium]|nr:hypothetical protein [Cyanobacteria bacterium GSL.Bin1]
MQWNQKNSDPTARSATYAPSLHPIALSSVIELRKTAIAPPRTSIASSGAIELRKTAIAPPRTRSRSQMQ